MAAAFLFFQNAILDHDFCQNRYSPPSIVGQWLHHIFTKWPPATFLVFRFSPGLVGFFHSMSSIMAVSNMKLIHTLVSQLRETQALAIISPKFEISGDLIIHD